MIWRAYLKRQHGIEIQIRNKIGFAWIEDINHESSHYLSTANKTTIETIGIDGRGERACLGTLGCKVDREAGELEPRYTKVGDRFLTGLYIKIDGLVECELRC